MDEKLSNCLKKCDDATKEQIDREIETCVNMPLMKMFKKDESKVRVLEHKLHLAQTDPEPVFNLSGCSLSELPSGVYSMCKVFRKEKLDLSKNNFSALPDNQKNRVSDLCDLLILNIEFNAIEKLSCDFTALRNLEELYLNNNKLRTIPDSISELRSLKVIEVRANLLNEFPTVLCQLRKLETVDLRENHILAIPKEVGQMSSLNNLRLDCDMIDEPPRDIAAAGAKAIKSYFNGATSHSSDDDVDNDQVDLKEMEYSVYDRHDAYQVFLEKKEAKRLDRINWERQMKDDGEKQFEVAGKQQSKKKVLLQELLNEQEFVVEGLLALQCQKAKDKESVMVIISALESHSNKLIDNLTRWQNKQESQRKILEELEEQNRELFLRQDEHITLRKELVVKSIELLIDEGLIDSSATENSKFQCMLEMKKVSHDKLRSSLLVEEDLQKVAFEVLQRSRDEHHRIVSNQIKLVEKELATLTLAEVKRKNFKFESNVTDVSQQRTALASLLGELIREREIRERDLKARLGAMEYFKENEYEDDNYWLLQYQKLLHHEPISYQLKQLGLDKDPNLVTVLLNCDEERLEPFLHVFVAHNLYSFEDIRDKSEKELISLGIEDYEIAKEIVDGIQMVANEARPSAPLEDEEASAPPLDVYFEIDCVICLDRVSNTIFFPCGHVCCCTGCSFDLTLCPLCRLNISNKRPFNLHM